MGVNIKVWTGSRTARVTDMENAGKRGKKCPTLRFSGAGFSWSDRLDDPLKEAVKYSDSVLYYLEHEAAEAPYDEVRAKVLSFCSEARAKGVPDGYVAVYEEEIRGVDAPRPVLTAGVEGKWSAGADEKGISMCALDDVNEWKEITHPDQTGPRAYDIAKKVWPLVQNARTLSQAANILRTAGARLHGYCGLD